VTVALRFRGRRHAFTWIALCAFMWSVGLSALEIHVADTDEAGFQFAGSCNGTLRVGKPPSAAAAPEHCIFCHWHRAVSGAMPSATARFASPSIAQSPCQLLVSRLTAVSFSSHSSRAPPLHA
jgi:hypothetical protein